MLIPYSAAGPAGQKIPPPRGASGPPRRVRGAAVRPLMTSPDQDASRRRAAAARRDKTRVEPEAPKPRPRERCAYSPAGASVIDRSSSRASTITADAVRSVMMACIFTHR